ncbi:MAG: hypothetical protein JWN10_2080 [Solirubrobacterales bacterium]|nr:hypothetical protein [Solirubrobacterales bacterium]
MQTVSSRAVIHLADHASRSVCGQRFIRESESVVARRGYPKLISWEAWLKLVHPLPFRLCKRCSRQHARRYR